MEGWFEVPVRVQYPQVDAQGVVHHAVYLHYFEYGRTEMLRALAMPYARIEEEGIRLMVVEAGLSYRASARYDDILRVRTRVQETSRVRIHLEYRILRTGGEEVVCEGTMVLACIGADGRPRRLPPELSSALERASSGSS